MKYLLTIALSALLITAFAPRAGAADADANPIIQPDGTAVFAVKSEPFTSKSVALEAAFIEGQRQIADFMSHRGHSYAYTPSIEFIKTRMLKKTAYSTIELDSSESTDRKLGNAFVASVELQMTRDIEKKFRSAGRVTTGLWGVGCATAAFLVIGAFFRLDEWTKGFLTNWLLIGAAGVIAGLCVFWFLIG